MTEYTREQLEDMDWDDFDDDSPREPWPSKRTNPTGGYAELHVIDLNKIEDGDARRMYAIYGVPVGWGINDAPIDELRARLQELEEAEDEGEEAYAACLDKYGLLDDEHHMWIRDRIEDSEVAQKADAQQLLDAQTAALKQQMQSRIDGELKGELEPVEGISLEAWAHGQAKLAQGTDVATILGELKIEQPQWDRVSAEWNARMARDTTATIATVYGQAFSGAGAGQFAQAGADSAAQLLDAGSREVAGEEPIPFERWIEITEAQNAASAQGIDASTVLKNYGMTPADWGTVSGWWSQKFNANAMEMIEEYNRLSEKYREKFKSGGAGSDIEF